MNNESFGGGLSASVIQSAGDDVRARVHFEPNNGQIWLHERRMLLIHAEVQALLRKELIETLGINRAKWVFSRMGYAAGIYDAELVRHRAEGLSDREAFMTGPQLHALEGAVKVTPLKLEINLPARRFYGEFQWENSWESLWHRRLYGDQTEPVCWTQIGYACGYTSAFMGFPVLYKEVECSIMGHKACRIIGKPLDAWDDASDFKRFLNEEALADQQIDFHTQVDRPPSTPPEKRTLPSDMIGNSPGFVAAYELLQRAAGSHIAVLLLGETGVGKELFARALHARSARSREPFVAINCAGIPADLVEAELFGVEKGAYTSALASRPGRFERAHGGTLFLDEIGDLPLAAQAKLLRVLQEGEVERLGDTRTRKVNVRLVAATNADLKQLVQEKKFRADLFYRLNAYQIFIPPLRERKEDISTLAKHFLARYQTVYGKKLRGFSDKAKRSILRYSWPGNIRELQNCVERGVILASDHGQVETVHLFAQHEDVESSIFGVDDNGSLKVKHTDRLCEAVFNGGMSLEQVEDMLIEIAVDKARGNLSSAARMLGMTRATLAYRLKRRPNFPLRGGDNVTSDWDKQTL